MSEEERTAHKEAFIIDIGTQSEGDTPDVDASKRRESTCSSSSWDDNPRLDQYLKEHQKAFVENPLALMEVADRLHAAESAATDVINVEGISLPQPPGNPVGPSVRADRPNRSVD